MISLAIPPSPPRADRPLAGIPVSILKARAHSLIITLPTQAAVPLAARTLAVSPTPSKFLNNFSVDPALLVVVARLNLTIHCIFLS